MTTPSKCVYCYQFGSYDCYRIGQTKHSPEKRKRGWAGGSPKKMTLYKKIPSETPTKLETFIHHLLDEHRAENGDYFNVTAEKLDEAIEKAIVAVAELHSVCSAAAKLKRKKPNDEMAEATDEMKAIHLELRKLVNDRYFMERRIELLKSKIQLEIRESLGMKGIASWKWRDKMRMDTTRFKREHEDVYKAYEVNCGGRVFLLDRIDFGEDEPKD